MAKKKNKEAKNEEKAKEEVQEKVKEEHNDDAKKKKEDEAPKEPPPVVLKTDIHCEGCASKLTKLARLFPGVQSAKAEMGAGKVTVVGQVDPLELRDFIAQKTRKKIDVISPIPVKSEKDKEGKKEEKKEEKKVAEEKAEKKEAPLALTTSVIKMTLHCQGCIEKIQKIVSKTKGVVDVSVDKQKETITVKGTMDVTALADSLKERLKRNAEVVPPSKEKEKNKEKEKEKEETNVREEEKKKMKDDNGGGGKKEKKADGGETAMLAENRFMAVPGGFGYSGLPGFPQQPSTSFVQPGQTVWFDQNSGFEPGYWYPSYGGYPPHMKFNDENPNACSVM